MEATEQLTETVIQTITWSDRCTEPGCVWPSHDGQRCLYHLRMDEDPTPFESLDISIRYGEVGRMWWAQFGVSQMYENGIPIAEDGE